MVRTACVELPVFPLQHLLLRRPDWRTRPVAVVDVDAPQGKVLWVNDRARSSGVLPGMRYAAALSLAAGLCADVVAEEEVAAAVATVAERLRRFTPNVEPAAGEPGTFWLDAGGLERLYPSLGDWAGLVRADLENAGWRAGVVVGFGRFGTYALAKARRGLIVLRDADEERALARQVPLDRIAFEPEVRDALHKLGVETVGRLLDLQADGLGRRFGPELHRLRRMAAGELDVPLQPDRPEPPTLAREDLEHAETDVPRLLVVIERLLGPLVEAVGRRGHAVAELRIGFRFDRLGDHLESIRPAAPTLEAAQLLELVRLRLEAIRRLPDGVVELVLVAAEVAAERRQLDLLAERPQRDVAAAKRALARVRAHLGGEAVVRARLREGHLPEGRFAWEPFRDLPEPAPRPVGAAHLVRRIHARPLPLPPRPRHEPDGWMLHGLEQGPVMRVVGPYVVSGGWWNRPVHREYHFAETKQGELLWVFYDRARRRWFLHGRVE